MLNAHEEYENSNNRSQWLHCKHLEFYLKRMGLDPACYDIQDDSRENYKQVDITDKESVKNIDINVDYIYMFAGLTGTYAGFDKYETYVSINEIGLLNLLDAIRNSEKKPKIVFSFNSINI